MDSQDDLNMTKASDFAENHRNCKKQISFFNTNDFPPLPSKSNTNTNKQDYLRTIKRNQTLKRIKHNHNLKLSPKKSYSQKKKTFISKTFPPKHNSRARNKGRSAVNDHQILHLDCWKSLICDQGDCRCCMIQMVKMIPQWYLE